jgi:putative acetyltransferase
VLTLAKTSAKKMSELYFAHSPEDMDAAREIFEEYQAFLQVDLCFQGFRQELAQLPQPYHSPNGCIIFAKINGEVAGCVALRPLASGICEMKRLYVRPAFRGHHLGRLLVEELLTFARQRGYHTMQLDTLARLTEAVQLYRRFGFEEITPYNDTSLEGIMYFGLRL